MNKIIVVLGLILIVVGGVMLFGNFNQTKSSSWDSLFPGVAPKLYLDKQPIYAHIDLSEFTKGEGVKVTVTPTESDDSILLLLMTPQIYQQFLASTVGKSDVLVWQEPATPGGSVSLDYNVPNAGDYVIVLRAWGDTNQDGIPFQLSMEIYQPLDLTLPGLGVAVVGLVVLVLGFIRKPAAKAMQQVAPAPPYAQPQTAPPPTPSSSLATKYCISCGAQIAAQAKHCSKCGAPQE
jgi:hypothetical protein